MQKNLSLAIKWKNKLCTRNDTTNSYTSKLHTTGYTTFAPKQDKV